MRSAAAHDLPQGDALDNTTDLLGALQLDIAERLRPVCSNLSEETFQQLVRDVAAVKLKYGPETDSSGSLSEELSVLLDANRGAGGSTPSV